MTDFIKKIVIMSNIHFIFLLYIFIIALYLGFTPKSAELPL